MKQHDRYQASGYRLHFRLFLLALLALVPLYLWRAQAFPTAPGELRPPAFSPPPGHYQHSIQVSLRAGNGGQAILFTTDGSIPTAGHSHLYQKPIRISVDTPGVHVLRARTMLADGALSEVVTASYVAGWQARLPVISLVMEPEDLWDREQGIYANPEERGIAWERPAHVTYFEESGQSGVQTAAGVRIHGQISRTYDKKSFRLYFRNRYGNGRLDYPLWPDSDVDSFDRLVVHNGGQDIALFSANWTLLRTLLMAELSRQTSLSTTENRPVALFVNGQPWGIYLLRERLDASFFEAHYGSGDFDLLDSPLRTENDPRVVEEWNALMQYVATHDLADSSHYATVQAKVDIDSLIDHAILQMYAANNDWPVQNEFMWRRRGPTGRWQWILWDVDYSFGLSPLSHVEFDMVQWILQPANADLERSTLLLRRLFDNVEFRDRFLTRLADLLNTTLQPEMVVAHVDRLEAELEDDIVYEIARWSSPGNWRANVEYLRRFARQRPEILRQQIINGFSLSGTAALTIDRPAAGAGTVFVNGRQLPTLPHQGTYFEGTTIQIGAVPEPGYRFIGWQLDDTPSLLPMAILSHTVTHDQTFVPWFAPLPPDQPRPGDVEFSGYHLAETTTQPDCQPGPEWISFTVRRPGGLDLRGWRLTDNDGLLAQDEGSLILRDRPQLARVRAGTEVRVVLQENSAYLPLDDMEAAEGRLMLYVGNDAIDAQSDPWFGVTGRDHLILLAPGPISNPADDQAIALLAFQSDDWNLAVPLAFSFHPDHVTRLPTIMCANP